MPALLIALFITSFTLLSNAQTPQLWLERDLTSEEEKSLQKFEENFSNQYNLTELKSSMMSSSSDAFEMELFKYRKEQLGYIKNKATEGNWEEDFTSVFEKWVRYNYNRFLFSYPVERAAVTGDQIIRPLPVVLIDNIWNEVDLNNPDALESAVYKDLINYHSTYYTASANNFEPYASLNDKIKKAYEVCNEYYTGQVQAYAMAQQLINYGSEVHPKDLKLAYKIFRKQNKDDALQEKVLNVCKERMNEKVKKKKKKKRKRNKNKKKAKKDQPFKLLDLKGNEVYLSDFEGKVIYVDFWASWCGPCRQQFPFAKKLKESFSDKELKDIVFLYISSDKNENAWRNAIEKYEIEGTHTWSPNNIEKSAGRHFNVYSIPRYMLINKAGEIADENAKRPSMPGIKEDILELLNQ